MRFAFYFAACATLACARASFAQERPTAAPEVDALTPSDKPGATADTKARSGWAALPIGTYSPETSLGLGAFATHFLRLPGEPTDSRPSSVSAVGLYTLKQQLIVELIPEAYWSHQQWHVWARLDYRRYPNTLWAIGNRATAESDERYTEDRVRWQALVDRALFGTLRLEGKAEVISMGIEDVQEGGLLDSGALPGARGGLSVGVGAGLLWDSRDHMLTPHSGDLHELLIMTFGETIGSEFGFSLAQLNLRKYLPITATHTLALQLYAELQSGDVPFFKLAQLGGEDMLRGLYEGRFRDKALLAGQAEYRFPLFWRFSGVAHAGLGQVARNAAGLGFRVPEWAVGGGARVMLNTDERLNLRADVGFGRESYGFYVGINEVF
jgi:hypothetical protein